MFAEDLLDRFGLGFIPQRRAGAVGIDVLDILQIQMGILECHLHGPRGSGAFRMGRGDVVRIGRAAAAQ